MNFAIATVNTDGVLSTVIYALLGVTVMALSVIIVNVIFRMDIRKELSQDNNQAYGSLFGGLFIAIAIIIAAAII